jgi:pimeloyl-ACP methyl ester carboxylesterase
MLAPGLLEAVTAPVILAEGDASPPVIAEINTALARRLPNTRRLVVPEAGHMLPLTHPVPLGRAVMQMWATSG